MPSNRSQPPITFDDAVRDRMQAALRDVMHNEFEVDLGLVRTAKLYDFLVNMIGAAAYNQAVEDVQAAMQSRVLDLSGDIHAPVEYTWND